MFEHRTDPLLPRSEFFARLARCFGVGLVAVAGCLGIGMAGYHHFEKQTWIDAFANEFVKIVSITICCLLVPSSLNPDTRVRPNGRVLPEPLRLRVPIVGQDEMAMKTTATIVL